MTRTGLVLACVVALGVGDGVRASAQEVGSMYHVTGCEDGELTMPTPVVWRGADRMRVAGRLTGRGREEDGLRCQGAVVRVLSVTSHPSGETMVEVRSITNGLRGWIDPRFIGQHVPVEQCRVLYTAPLHIARCEGGQG